MNRDPLDLPESTSAHVADQLINKKWGELEMLEHPETGRLLLPDKLYKKNTDGTMEEIPIMLCVPRQKELREARVKARRISLEEGLDLDRDADLVETFENICILSKAMKNATSPYESMEPDPQRLEKHYDTKSISQLWEKLDRFTLMIDPAPHNIPSKEEFIAITAAIAKERNLYPLAVYGQDVQTFLVSTMALLLMKSLDFKSFLESSEPWIAEYLPSNDM